MALRKYELDAVVKSGGRIEIDALPVSAGDIVHVTIEVASNERQFPLEALFDEATGPRRSYDAIDRELSSERDDWSR